MLEEAMRSYYRAYNSEDADLLAQHLTEDVTLASAAGVQTGREAYLATYRYMVDNFEDRMEPEAIEVNDDTATVHILDLLTARDDIADFLGEPVSKGQLVELRLIGRYTFRDGKIARIEISPAAQVPLS